MLRIALQSKGRLNEKSVELLREAGISLEENSRRLLSRSPNFPMEVLYLRDDDIPQTVSCGIADLGIVGLNEVKERNHPVEVLSISVSGNAGSLSPSLNTSNIPVRSSSRAGR